VAHWPLQLLFPGVSLSNTYRLFPFASVRYGPKLFCEVLTAEDAGPEGVELVLAPLPLDGWEDADVELLDDEHPAAPNTNTITPSMNPFIVSSRTFAWEECELHTNARKRRLA
jgi:hypothetical protein